MLKRLRAVTANEYGISVAAIWVFSGVAVFFVLSTALCHWIWGADTADLPGFRHLIDVDSEGNLPTWYAAALLHFAALLAWMIADRDDLNAINWRVIAFLLLVMGIDEVASLHNTPNRRLGEWLGYREGIMMNAWVIPAAVVCLIVAMTMLRFLFRQPRWLAIGLTLAAGLYVTGALVLEMASTHVEFQTAGFDYDGAEYYSLTFEMIAVLEEAFEYSGVLLTIWLFMRRARQLGARVSLAV